MTRSAQWPDVISLAAAWRVIPQVRRSTRGIEIEPEAQLRLQQLAAAAAAHSRFICHLATEVLEQFEDSGIRYAAFKGVASIAKLYGQPSERMVNDLDVLIQESQLPQVVDVLKGLGYLPQPFGDDGFDARNLEPWIAEQLTKFRMANHCVVFLRGEMEVDLHWRIGSNPPPRMRVDAILDRARRQALLGRPVSIASPIDMMLLTAHHCLRSWFRSSTTLKDVGDLASWAQLEPAEWDHAELIDAAHEARLAVPLLAQWKIITMHAPTSPISQWVEELERTLPAKGGREAERLAAAFESQLEDTPLRQQMIDLFASPKQVVSRWSDKLLRRATGRPLPTLEETVPQWTANTTMDFRELVRVVAKELFVVRRFARYVTVARAQDAYDKNKK